MSHRLYLPDISLKNNSISIDLPNRKRNISFDSISFQTQTTAEHEKASPLPIKKIQQISYCSKKSHLFDFVDKNKINNHTKRCQQRMVTYINLKKELSDINLCKKITYKQRFQSFDKKQAKLQTINHLNVIYNFSLKKKPNIQLGFLPKPKRRAQTLRNDFKQQDFKQEKSLRKCISPLEASSKRYSDLSLKQITECDIQFIQKRKKNHQKQQLTDLRQRILIIKDTIQYQQPLKGW